VSNQNEASVAKGLAHLLFTSEAAGASLSENFLNATRTQSSCEKSKSQRSAESRGFSPGTPVSSHRESWQSGLGKKGPQQGSKWGQLCLGTQSHKFSNFRKKNGKNWKTRQPESVN
jgi:hypothetical protein